MGTQLILIPTSIHHKPLFSATGLQPWILKVYSPFQKIVLRSTEYYHIKDPQPNSSGEVGLADSLRREERERKRKGWVVMNNKEKRLGSDGQ